MIQRHPDGVSIDWNGEKITHGGICVSVTNNIMTPSQITPAFIARLRSLSKKFEPIGKTCVGSWRDSKGQYFIDLTIITQDTKKALQLAKQYKQQAVFNLDTLETIAV